MLNITNLALKLDQYSDIKELMSVEKIELTNAQIEQIKQKYIELKTKEQYIFSLS